MYRGRVYSLSFRGAKERDREEIERRHSHPAQRGRNRQTPVQKVEQREVMNQNRAIDTRENFRSVECQDRSGVQRLLRRQGKTKTEKAEPGKKCALNHGLIHSQKSASASEIF